MPNFDEVAVRQQVNEELYLQEENGQVVVSSRVVAERFGKQHKHVLDSIRELSIGVAQKSVDLFIDSRYQHPQNKQWYKEYLLTRDGFTLLAMGFTGKEALHWKLKYIEAFNKMEQELKGQQKPMCLEDILIAQLQDMKALKEQVNQATHHALEAKAGVQNTKEEIQNMRVVISLDTTSWRADATDLLNKIATYRGGTTNIYQETRREAYDLLSKRFGVNLEQRLTNKRRRMADEGICKSRRDKLSKIDIIAEDKKLIEGFIAIVKEMAIRYGIA